MKVLAASSLATVPAQEREATGTRPALISTWKWGQEANQRAAEIFQQGGSLLDAVEKGINVVELDPNIEYVGYGGLPNSEGVVELDAGIMDGTRHRAGAVCALRGVKTPISVARLVMESTRHTTMAGPALQQFAEEMGFHFEQLLTPNSLQKYLEWKSNPHRQTFWLNSNRHDTIGMVATDMRGHVVSGCSTSGLPWKIPGRVADSPLVGCGYYADDNAGGASATGDGDLMSNYCTSVSIVRMMERGASPHEACQAILQHMVKTDSKNKDGQCAVIAMNNRGETGAAAMNKEFHLQYAVWRNGESRLLDSLVLY